MAHSEYLPITSTNSTSKAPASFSIGGTATFWVGKRLFDVAVSVALLPLLIVFAAVLAVLNPLLNPGSLLHQQKRLGRDLRPFIVIKFRSMRPGTNEVTSFSDSVEFGQITPLGRWVQQLRIDELPQILSVLRGDMSLIGPRPGHFEHSDHFPERVPEHQARFMVRPGISGLAQVALGHADSVEETRAEANADVAYVCNVSLALELRILLAAMATIRRGKAA